MKKRSFQQGLVFIALAVLAQGVLGCASLSQYNKELKIADEHVYQKAVSAIWPAVVQVLRDENYTVRKAYDPNGTELVSDWNDMYYQRHRYVVTATKVSENQTKIEFQYEVTKVETDAETTLTRDKRMELRLLKRLDPGALPGS